MDAEIKKRWPGETDQAFPGPFNVVPDQPRFVKPGQLTSEQVKQFFDQGFLILENFFHTETEINPVKQSIEVEVDELAKRLYTAGKVKSLYEEYGLFQRLTKLEEDFPGSNILLHIQGNLPQSFRDLWSNPRLLNVMEQLLGTEDIIGHPVWNLRPKTPKNDESTVPWHQDVCYLDQDSYNVLQPVAWIPLLDATVNNGCLQVVKGGHKTGRVAKHVGCYGNTWYLMLQEDVINNTLDVNVERDTVTCEVPYGGMLLLNNLIPHRSLSNLSDNIRWSIDLRWQRADQPVGFHGLKQGVVMRTAKEQKPHIDWASLDNKGKQDKTLDVKKAPENEFDPVISGPWMGNWEIIHQNRHTARYTEVDGTSWHS